MHSDARLDRLVLDEEAKERQRVADELMARALFGDDDGVGGVCNGGGIMNGISGDLAVETEAKLANEKGKKREKWTEVYSSGSSDAGGRASVQKSLLD